MEFAILPNITRFLIFNFFYKKSKRKQQITINKYFFLVAKDKFHGTGVTLITPFKTDNSVDYGALEKLIGFRSILLIPSTGTLMWAIAPSKLWWSK